MRGLCPQRLWQHGRRTLAIRCLATATPRPVEWLHSVGATPRNGHPPALRSDYDAILVLAGGQTESGGVPLWVERRLDASHDLQQRQANRGCPILCLGAGTPHKPPVLAASGHVIHESTSCSHYLLARGASPSAILKESSSFDTVGNAYFSLVIHAVPAGWRRLAVVTSDFHMPRTQALFEDMYRLAATTLFADPDRFHLTFLSVSDEGLFDQNVLDTRREKEAESVVSWRGKSAGMATMGDLHAWLHASHTCYSVAHQQDFARPHIQDARLLASY